MLSIPYWLCMAGSVLFLASLGFAEKVLLIPSGLLLIPGGLGLLIHGVFMMAANRGLNDGALIPARVAGIAAAAAGLAALSGGIELLSPAGPWLLGLVPFGLVLMASGVWLVSDRELARQSLSATQYMSPFPSAGPVLPALTSAGFGLAALVVGIGDLSCGLRRSRSAQWPGGYRATDPAAPAALRVRRAIA